MSSVEIDVRVPATLSNLGPGFDVLGLAVTLENRFHFRARKKGHFEADGKKLRPEQHLSLKTAVHAQEVFGGELLGIEVTQEESIPRFRGLGSSATARVAGFLAWSGLTQIRPALSDALAFLSELEGHPDNVVPAMLGGLTICADVDRKVEHLRLDPPTGLRIALCIPERTVATREARAALPPTYSRKDSVFNLSRLGFLLAGLWQERSDLVSLGCQDRIHQPYRKNLIGPVDEAFSEAQKLGAAAFISGSGSTLAAFVLDPSIDAKKVAQNMAIPFERDGISCRTLSVLPEKKGAWTEK